MSNITLKYDELLSKEEIVEKLKLDLPQYIIRKGLGKRFQVRKSNMTFRALEVILKPKKNEIEISSNQDKGFFFWFIFTGILAFFVNSKSRKAYTENMKLEIKDCLDKYHNQ